MTDPTRPSLPTRPPPEYEQAAAVFDIGEEYEFEIIKDDDGDGSLTLSIRKIQVRFVFPKPSRDQIALDPQNARLCQRGQKTRVNEYGRLVFERGVRTRSRRFRPIYRVY